MTRALLLLLAGCLHTTADGDPSQPDVGKRYECSHVETCEGVSHTSETTKRCAASRYDAETEELALCRDECSCLFMCEPVRGSICLLD